jgi:hypothetical protein
MKSQEGAAARNGQDASDLRGADKSTDCVSGKSGREAALVRRNAVENNGKTTQKRAGGITGKGFQPGQSGNPGGRPKNAPLSHACRELLARAVPGDPEGRTYSEAIAGTLAERALAGDIRAAQEIADRAEGKPRQSLEIENSPLKQAFERMTAEELLVYAETGNLPGWFQERDDSANDFE